MPFYEYIAIGLMVVFILALFTGYPVAWLLAGLSLLFATIGITLGDLGYDTFLMTSWAKFSGVIDRFDSIMSNWVLVSLPMFVYMGLMLDKSGVADTMMRNFVKVFGGIRGGLGITVVFIGILLAASTGIVGASVVLLAVLSMPIMLEHRYSKAIASGTVATSPRCSTSSSTARSSPTTRPTPVGPCAPSSSTRWASSTSTTRWRASSASC